MKRYLLTNLLTNLLTKGILTLFVLTSVNLSYSQILTYDYTGTIQEYVVPDGVSNIRITAVGAAGGEGTALSSGEKGNGASMAGNFIVIPGQVLKIIVGGEGSGALYTGGGGGGSFVWDDDTENLLIAAGGGGGGGATDAGGEFTNGVDASIEEEGTHGRGFSDGGGIGGNGGTDPSAINWASGGAGWLSGGNDGTIHLCTYNSTGGDTPLSGGLGGTGGGSAGNNADGGFGGGGGNNARCGAVGGGGGGGYSGGGCGGEIVLSQYNAGGGGGSFNDGTMQENIEGVGTSNGMVTIEVTCSALVTTVTDYDPCINEYITLTAESETGGEISWEDGVEDGVPFIPGAPGLYSYTANSTGEDDCSAVIEINVRPFPTVIANASPTELCEGESMILYGGGAETYEWSPGDIADRDVIYPAAGTHTYIATGTDEFGCVADDEVTVVVHSEPILIITADKTVVCQGDEVTLTASGGVEYDWDSPVENGIPFAIDAVGSFTYEVEMEDVNGCEVEGEITITVGAPIEITYAVTAEVLGDDGAIEIDVIGGTMPYTFDWDNDGTGDFDDPEDLTGIAGGDYVVVIKDAGTCSKSETITVDTQLGVGSNDLFQMEIYPNPASSVITLSSKGQLIYSITDLSGKIITNGNFIDNKNIEINGLAKGAYFITVEQGTISKTFKFLKI
ncbi:T9SS type A sorting domain-containing protein [Crocinitomix catalasitica]|uniref:T9SS type A sorting domain-containing protein n=1 Tax=Crocinitomix catalasitica TaxID=184607 RepID=UPI0012F976E9|nr:T9SS type A sorting domain-containing protein [Crocinitomix catalasitica]